MKGMNYFSGKTWKGTLLTSLVAAAFSIAGTGCQHGLQSTANAEGRNGVFHKATEHDSSGVEYVIDPPDDIIVKAQSIKEIDNVKQTVRPDGTISLNLLGEIKVAGMTPRQVQAELTKVAAKYYSNPDIKIEVTAQSKFFMVFGRGATIQKKIPYTGNDNVVKALAEAGLSDQVWPQQVWVVRPGRDGQPPARAVVNFQKMAETGDMSQNYALQQGDIINLPDSPLAHFQFKSEQIFAPINGVGGVASQAVQPGAVR
jgi:protein involved in polysaccharide export with SLBB domain